MFKEMSKIRLDTIDAFLEAAGWKKTSFEGRVCFNFPSYIQDSGVRFIGLMKVNHVIKRTQAIMIQTLIDEKMVDEISKSSHKWITAIEESIKDGNNV